MRSRDNITIIAGLLALAVAVLAVGGASRWVVVLLTAIAAVAAAMQITSRRHLARSSPLLLLISIATALTALQLVPVPEAIFATLNPTAYALVLDGKTLLEPSATGSWLPLSLDPANTRVELAKSCAYLMLAWLAVRVAVSERGRQGLLSAVSGIAGLVAVIGLVHAVLGAESLFGMYTPSHSHPALMAPLLNPNHLACLLVLGAITAGGLALHERRAPPVRALWILIAVVCIGVALATRSRGAVLGLAAGTTVTAMVVILQRLKASRDADRSDALRVVIPASVVLLCSLVLAVYLGGGEVRTELENTRLQELSDPRSKYAAWRSAWTLVRETPFLGVGRGAFQSAFTRVHSASGEVTFSHVENEYLQILVDWGFVGAIALASALGLGLLVLRRRWRNGALAAGAIGGLTSVCVQSVVDFGLELPGLAVPTILVASTLFYVPLEKKPPAHARLAARALLVMLTVIAGVSAALPGARTLAEDHAEFGSRRDLAAARSAFERHPVDYLSAAQVSRAATSTHDRIAFLNHAMRLHPAHPGLHRIAAKLLAATGRTGQAALEYRLALLGTADPEPLITEILHVFSTASAAADALPPDHRMWGRILSALSDQKRDDVALAYLVDIVESGSQPGTDVHRRVLHVAKKLGNLSAAERAARSLLQLEPSAAARIEVARIQIQNREYEQAVATLQPVVTEVVTSPDHITAKLLLCDVHIARTDWTTARTCLMNALIAPGVSLDMRRKIHLKLATTEEALGNPERARFERMLSTGGAAPTGSAGTPAVRE